MSRLGALNRPSDGHLHRDGSVLGIPVSPELFERWRTWLAPGAQPFFGPKRRGAKVFLRAHAPEVWDSCTVWRIPRDHRAVVWLDEGEFSALPRPERARLVRMQATLGRGGVPSVRAWSDLLDPTVLRAQADGHRFVWWPSLIDESVARRIVEHDRLRCRRREVRPATWKAAADVLPHVEELAGTFPSGSTTNCFGATLAAAGACDAETDVQRPQLERWLRISCRPGGDDSDPGTVLLWRDDEGLAVHSAVTIGDGWAFEKPSQEWHSPRYVATTADLLKHNRVRGWHLTRYRIQSSST
jgi:hypothetical protein